jgi:ABC-type polysaccharide/polyol phosphate export permease
MTNQAAGIGELIASTSFADRSLLRGFRDLREGLLKYRLWTMLGWNDIRQRYRRSILGPFWITVSMAIFITLLGVIYSRIFKMDVKVFLPYVAMGIISWGLVSATILESCSVFSEGASVIKQIKLPYSIYPLRMMWRSLIVFFHTVILIVPIAIFFHINLGLNTLLVIPGVLLVVVNQTWVAIVVGIVSTRYRDLNPLIGTAVQVSMFCTPIMWPVDALGNARIIAEVNPFYHLVQLIRAPLLGNVPEALSYEVVLGVCAVGYVVAAAILSRALRRLVYWL